MLITTQTLEGRHVLQLQGRFDANWADQVGKAIDSAIRAGHHDLDLDLAEVNYISSAGIRVLLKYHKQLKAARGTLRVLRPTAPVLEVLQLSGIARLLVATTGEAASELDA
jgi:anti-sigma B factor antagonist